ncbi:hypothetical protein EVU96_08580 [Bacillus infantis]|uniref:hypothetical protein n=1 Tax=Bacillus infantis TaxID=324767 RepID=UPI00101B6EE7|nr:hypothetical protein [Bacillus infantis]RYI30458.1 hypothetical protein EVU96_08580 [Bacillus infantis]
MCLASKYIDQIEEMMNGVKKDMMHLRSKSSYYDKEISSIYHRLELNNFNACEGYYIAKNLKELVQKRRLVKIEYLRLESLHNSLKIQTIEKDIHGVRKVIDKSKEKWENWCSNFDFTFSDIEEEVMH